MTMHKPQRPFRTRSVNSVLALTLTVFFILAPGHARADEASQPADEDDAYQASMEALRRNIDTINFNQPNAAAPYVVQNILTGQPNDATRSPNDATMNPNNALIHPNDATLNRNDATLRPNNAANYTNDATLWPNTTTPRSDGGTSRR